jgi:hypothetical protein
MSCCSAGGDPAWGAPESRSCAIVRKSLVFTHRAGFRSPQPASAPGRRGRQHFHRATRIAAGDGRDQGRAVGRVRRYRLTTGGRGEGWPKPSQGAPGNRAHLPGSAGQSGAQPLHQAASLAATPLPVSRRLASLQQSSRTGDAREFFTATASQPWRKAIAAATDQPVRPTMEDHL